ncbi:MAG: hypothetical protein AAFX08_04675 [Pseudomonadota bacterium]
MSIQRLFAGVALSIFASAGALAQTPQTPSSEGQTTRWSYKPGGARGSVYNSYRNAFFARGGYAFADAFLGVDVPTEYSAIGFAIGARQRLGRSGRTIWSIEEELYATRNSEDGEILGAPFSVTEWIFAPNAALRWQWFASDVIAPYASLGVGPGIVFTSTELAGTDA